MWLRVLPLALALVACGHGGGDHPGDGGLGDGAGGSGDGSSGGDGGGDGGVCGSCGAPPADSCEDATHLRQYDSVAGCQGSACVFPSHVVDCPYGCTNGACQMDACAALTCAPPPPSCSGSTLRTFSSTCIAGACATSESNETCAFGCSAGACLPPTCGATTCGTPPAATCLDAKVLSGAAQIGACSGTCTYAPVETLCSQGCFAGACDPGSTESIFMPPPPGPSGSSWNSNIAFAVDAAGRPHLVAQDGNGNITWRHLDESGWHDVTVDTNLGSGVQVALALDPAGVPVVAYYEPTNQRLRYAELRGTSFHVEEVSTISPAGQYPSIAVDAAGTRWIASNDGNLGLRVAHGHAGSWTFESLGTSYAGATQIAFDPAGVLHLVFGPSQSDAVPSGAYYQPPAYHATRTGGTWHVDQISPHGLVFKRGLAFAANGDALVAYGVVSAVGQNDELRLRRYGAISSDVLVQSIGNWLDMYPIGLYDARGDVKFIHTNAYTIARGSGDFWTEITHDFPPYPSVVDVVDAPDGRPRYLAYLSSNSPSNVSGLTFVTPPACVPSCSGATCGSDGCGGTCGACAGGQQCGPDRQCSPWLEETVNLPALATYPQMSLGLAMSPAGAHHLLVQYDFPEHYYTSGSTQDELFYQTDASGPWELPAPQTVVGIPSGNYAQLEIVDSSLQLTAAGPEAIFAYGLAGYTWSVEHAVPGMQPWMVDWSINQNMARPRLFAIASGAGVTYVVYECGYYGDVACVDRRDSSGTPQSTLTGDYAVAARAAVDSQGHVHILWTHWTTSPTDQVTLEYATDESGTLVSTPIPGEQTAGGSDVFHPAIALGPNDELHVAFLDVAGGVRHGAWTGSGFAIDNVTAATDFALAVDHAGSPVLLVTYGSAALWRPGAAGWTSEPIPSLGEATAPWLALDAADRPHVFFQDASAISHQLRLGWKP